MMGHIYVEEKLAARGYLEQLESLPTREAGESAADWQARCDEQLSSLLLLGEVTRDFAERAIGCAEHLASELESTPSMIPWCHREYYVAVNHHLDPADDAARWMLASQQEFPGDGEDGFIERTLLGLMS